MGFVHKEIQKYSLAYFHNAETMFHSPTTPIFNFAVASLQICMNNVSAEKDLSRFKWLKYLSALEQRAPKYFSIEYNFIIENVSVVVILCRLYDVADNEPNSFSRFVSTNWSII